MSNPESFISEVSEELRRDRLYALFRKWAWLPALLVILVVATAGWREWSISQHQARAQAFGDALLALAAIEDPVERSAAFVDLYASDTEADAKALARIYEAGILQEEGQTEPAIERLQEVTADPAVSPVYLDLALLKSLQFGQDHLDAGAVGEALDQLTIAGRPFRLLAQEIEAMHHFDAGRRMEAIMLMESMLSDAEITPEQTGRLRLFLASIGHDVDGDRPDASDGSDAGNASDEGNASSDR